jgi:uncharacterized protein YegP (UPF0339 family)
MIVMSGYFGIYPSTTGWRWRLVANNGFIIATAGEAYRNYADAENGIDVVKTAGRQDWNVYDDVQGLSAFTGTPWVSTGGTCMRLTVRS